MSADHPRRLPSESEALLSPTINTTSPVFQQSAPPNMSAAHRVFDITELAESIFLHLPQRDLLTSTQRVCQHWKAVIDESTLLQELLFFETIWNDAWNGPYDPGCTLYPLPDHVENPFAYLLSHPNPSDAFKLETASWRRMATTQPATTGAISTGITTRFATSRGHDEYDMIQAGYTLDEVYTVLRTNPSLLILGSSEWRAFEDYQQLQAIENMPRSREGKPEQTAKEDGLEDGEEDDEVAWEGWIAELRSRYSSTWEGTV